MSARDIGTNCSDNNVFVWNLRTGCLETPTQAASFVLVCVAMAICPFVNVRYVIYLFRRNFVIKQ